MMEGAVRYDTAEATSNAPLWAVLERLDNRVEEVGIQTERLRKQIDPLVSRTEKPVSNGRISEVGGVPSGSSQLVERLQSLESRLEEIGSRVCRWCNELEM